MNPFIYIAFRFHGNFYHSYRGDSADELGFGKDIRIIRHIINTLDNLNQQGIPINGTWDFENYFSLEAIIPQFCPDILESLQRRVKMGLDDIQVMSYNNGLISAHTAKEFEEAIQKSISNPSGSGLADLFNGNFQRSVRPQEMMFTPIHLKLYPAYGVETISLFYSGIPFNGFSNFIAKLAFEERYNPLTLSYPGISETMTLVPCYNIGDLIDHLSLRRWVKQLRKNQLSGTQPKDLLLVIDMDADDEFWVGFDVPILNRVYSTIQGLQGLVESIKDLDYIQFTTPDRYLKNHPPLNKICISQDTADGSFDGYASWAEKWSNQRLWTGLERIRLLTYQVRHLFGTEIPEDIEKKLNTALDIRIKLLSTTHFGMAAPVMNLTRENSACDLIQQGMNLVRQAFKTVQKTTREGCFSLIDYQRGEDTFHINYANQHSKGLICLPFNQKHSQDILLKNETGQGIPNYIFSKNNEQTLLFVDSFEPGQEKRYTVSKLPLVVEDFSSHEVKPKDLHNDLLNLAFENNGQLKLLVKGKNEPNFEIKFLSKITYAKKTLAVSEWKTTHFINHEFINIIRQTGCIQISPDHIVNFEREMILTKSLPYLYMNFTIQYPLTQSFGFNKGKAKRLQQSWDQRWSEVMPNEITPIFFGLPQQPLRIWKHNYFGHVSTYDLDYGKFSKNKSLDNINNHITHAWAALSNGENGILVAQTAEVNNNLAFCPVRTRQTSQGQQASLNPFGSYWGKQYDYAIADTGLGKFLTTTMSASDHINPLAPSFNGRTQKFSLLIAPYFGDQPDVEIQNDALSFTYPYILFDDGKLFKEPHHRSWSAEGLGTN